MEAMGRMWLALVVGAACVAADCRLTVDGQKVLPSEPWYHKLNSTRKHTVHEVAALNAPCNGFLRRDPYYVRAHSSDDKVLHEVNVRHEFAFLDKLLGGPPATILDLGANVGLASAYFAARYPSATVFAVEPNLHNFAMAGLNTNRAPNVHLFLGAVWTSSVLLHIDQEFVYEGYEWGYMMKELPSVPNTRPGAAIRGITVDEIMRRMQWSTIDYMKVDIECGEYTVFDGGDSMKQWISKVQCITMELHPWCKDKDPAAVRKALQDSGFTYKGSFGELIAWCRDKHA